MRSTVRRRSPSLWSLALASGCLLLPACGSDADDGGSAITSTSSDDGAGAGSGGADVASDVASGGAGDAPAGASEPVDVCALLSAEDGAAVAKASGLGGDANATATFGINATPEPVNTDAAIQDLGACRFEAYYSEAGSTEQVYTGAVVIMARSAEDFALFYGGGTPVPGLGDEAYSQSGSTVVRKGGVMLSSGENSYTEEFVQSLFAVMAPNLP